MVDKKYEIKSSENWLNEKRGLFVTLHTYPEKELRGCIGFTELVYPLKKALVEASVFASFKDTRFNPLTKKELGKVTIEVSVLTEPQLIEYKNPEELLEKIDQFKDGLILKKGSNSGLFLPQVWEQLPDKKEFLSNLCFKAGLLNPNAWKDKSVQVCKFNVQIFEEKEPNGNVIEKPLI